MSDDPQDRAEVLDEDVVDVADDTTGDDFGEALPDFPPDRPLGVDTVGVTAVEEDGGESFAERTMREVPEPGPDDVVADDPTGDVGQLVEPYVMSEDHEDQAVADAVPESEESAEEAAMHIVEEG